LSKVSISSDSTFVIIRTEDNSCFYLFSLKDKVIEELIN